MGQFDEQRRDQTTDIKLQKVNAFFNKKIAYFEDIGLGTIRLLGESESMSKERVIVKISPIAKYFSLRGLECLIANFAWSI